MLSKISISSSDSANLSSFERNCSHPNILSAMEMLNESGYYFTNCKNIVLVKTSNDEYKLIDTTRKNVIDVSSLYRIPIYFHKKTVWKTINSFDQNNVNIANNIRGDIINYLKLYKHRSSSGLIGLGGEYIGYFVNLSKMYSHFIGITNNSSIFDDAEYNNTIFNMLMMNYIVDYKDINFIETNLVKKSNYDCIVNLNKLNENIATQLLNLKKIGKINNLIIINCNAKNFDFLIRKFGKPKNVKWYENLNTSYIKVLFY